MNIKSTIDFFFRSRVSNVDSLAGVIEFNVVVMSSIVIVDICSVCCVSAIVVVAVLSVGVLPVNVDVIVELSTVDEGVCVISVRVVCAELVASVVLDRAEVDVPSRVVAGTVLVSRVVDESTSLLVVGSFVNAFVTCELIETGSVSAAVIDAIVVVVGSVSGL